ncbi:MAG: response regulator [Candidatus Kerfeldbacteria bacterium]|nr:response regulator [Candidatus Kerfeldbacteria bacterium]
MSSSSRILLIEDEPSLLSLYRLALQRVVKDILTATTVSEAKAIIQECITSQQLPKVILLDLLIPQKTGDHLDFSQRSGFVVLQHLRSLSQFKDVPVFVMTNLDGLEDRQRAEELGAQGYFVKSNIVPHDIVEQISPFLS